MWSNRLCPMDVLHVSLATSDGSGWRERRGWRPHIESANRARLPVNQSTRRRHMDSATLKRDCKMLRWNSLSAVARIVGTFFIYLRENQTAVAAWHQMNKWWLTGRVRLLSNVAEARITLSEVLIFDSGVKSRNIRPADGGQGFKSVCRSPTESVSDVDLLWNVCFSLLNHRKKGVKSNANISSSNLVKTLCMLWYYSI